MAAFTFTNSTQEAPPAADLITGFVIKAAPDTDIWSKPPAKNVFNAPVLHQTVPLSKFRKASAHINADWTSLYDQGGLILVLNRADGARKWIKTGIEFVNGKPHVSTVAKDTWADWSLLPIPADSHAATIEMAKEEDGSLWIYLVSGVQRAPIREVTWAFLEEDTTECWVGAYVAKPAAEAGDLVVAFKQFKVELSS
ncbi:hypothetical protein AJ80_01482 [Polytolypa hystricis UAMH7299]|uniref:DUF1349 domain-containing protein n=1 Tax=Polytolypa hystricis (strain UAMH7299) TaxID=1447883 RepID=A0A2B7Z0Y6_POLH7|nr:hypothetical protein AJ80_01482 [Polytolypa hystricis UAMH7299]